MSESALTILNPDAFDSDQRLEFIQSVARLLYSGQGSAGRLARHVELRESDGLRVLLGTPSSTVSSREKRVLEAVYSYVLQVPAVPRPDLWVSDSPWSPINPRRTSPRALDRCSIDFDFIESFGLRPAVWENEILFLDWKALVAKTKRGTDMSTTNLRAYTALAVFGFSDPSQFFI